MGNHSQPLAGYNNSTIYNLASRYDSLTCVLQVSIRILYSHPISTLTATYQGVKKDKVNLHKLGTNIEVLVNFFLTHAHGVGKNYALEQLDLLNACGPFFFSLFRLWMY